MTRVRRLPRLTVLVAAAALLAGCTSSGSGAEPVPVPDEPAFTSYVALGDSFTAGPLVPTTALADGCLRSDGNYPALLAERLDIARVTDVSCSGATTADLTGRQQTVGSATVRPQLDALRRGTDLVTLGIGGNDFALFSTLVQTCSRLRPVDPQGSPCAEQLRAQGVDLVARTGDIADRVVAALRRIEARAPEAEVLVVGYPRLTPETGTCPRRLPFAEGDYAWGDRLTRALNDALADAADRAGVGFVDMYAASEGHDICAEDPWVNGRRTDRAAALAYHPFAVGMEAVADEVADTLS